MGTSRLLGMDGRQTYREVNGARDERSDRALGVAGLGPATAQLCTAHKFDRGRIIVLAGDKDLATGELRV